MTAQESNTRIKLLLWFIAAAIILVLSWHAGIGRHRVWSIYLLLIPTLLGVLYVHRNLDHLKLRLWPALLILVLSMFCVDMAEVISHADPTVQNWLLRVVEDPQTTSYYTDALRFTHEPGWITTFQNQTLHLHSSTHPAGPILFYVFLIDHFGAGPATLAGSLLIAALSSMSVLVMYFFAGIWTDSQRDRLLICVLWALCPAIGLVYPEFDQVYPVLSMVMLASWAYSLRKSVWYAVLLGFTFFIGTLFAYNLLVIGTFVVGTGVGFLWMAGWERSSFLRLGQAILIGATVFVALWAGFSLTTGYHPIASFLHALQVQKVIEVRPKGLYSAASNVYNYSVGSGFLPEILGVLFLVALLKSPDRKNVVWIATVSAALTLVAVELTGVLDYEAQRVWLFLQPLIFVPATLRLREFSRKEQACILLAQWALLATIGRTIVFVMPFH